MKSESSHFSAPWGTSVRTVSCIVVIATMCGAGAAVIAPRMSVSAKLGVTAGSMLLLVLAAAMTVRGYAIANDVLIIKRLGWTTKISLVGLLEATADPKALRWSLRLWGNGGLFVVSGHFWNKALGRYRAYVTDVRRSVVLKFPGSSVVISPDSPADFIAQLRARG